MSKVKKYTKKKVEVINGVTFTRDLYGQWRWHIPGKNGRLVVMAAEGDGFTRLSRAKDNYRTARKLMLSRAL